MGSLRHRIKKLEDGGNYQRLELVCEVCGKQITVVASPGGSVWLDLIVLDWSAHQPEENDSYRNDYHPGLVELYEHEHPEDNFRDKKSGLLFYDPGLTGVSWTASAYEDSQTPTQTREDGF